jgi:D-alanyl-D-alanine carboxypeptidase (penicillin-binding protein 5/6)
MKRIFLSILLICLAGNAFAARARLTPISNLPYTGAIVVDVSTGQVLFEDGADKPVYPASVIKLMDFLLILELIESGKATLTDNVHVTAEAAKMGGSQVYLKEGESFTLDEMLYALSIKSANDVAMALAIHFAGTKDNFVKLMNERAAELEMTNTTFTSVHGLPPSAGQKPDVSTARDIAKLAMEIVKHPMALRYTSTKEKWFRNNSFEMLSHNRLVGSFEGCDGLKTGYFAAGGFSIAATAVRNERRVIAVVMGCKSRPVRDQKARELLNSGFLNLPEFEKPPVAPLDLQAVQEPTPVAKTGSVLARTGNYLRFIGKLILVLVLIVLIAGALVLIVYLIKRHRERWKYRF